jgi:hypothetical protein
MSRSYLIHFAILGLVFAVGCGDDAKGTAGAGGSAGAGGAGGGTAPDPITKTVSNVCVNSLLTAQLSYLPYELTAAPLAPVVDGTPVDVRFTGIALVPASTLNAGIYAVPGLTEVAVTAVSATVAVRSGATGTTPTLVPLEATPFDATIAINMSVSECNAAYPAGQNGHDPPCVTEPISIPLNSDTGTLTPTGGPGGEILVGWDETTDPTTFPITPPLQAGAPLGPTGIRVLIADLILVAFECTMGECAESGSGGVGDFDCGDGSVPGDKGGPLLDSQLLSIPISP